MVQASVHHLLSLPDDQIVQKLREMSLNEILKFSLISERCKDLVTSIEIKGVSLHVHIGSDITVTIITSSTRVNLIFYREPDMYWGIGSYGRKKKLTEPQSVFVDVTDYIDGSDETSSKWEKRDFTMKNWLKHLQEIFSYHKVDKIRFSENSFEFVIDDIKEVFGNITKVKIEDTGCYAFNRMILQKFSPIDELSIMTENFQDSKIAPSLLMQNHVYLNIDKSDTDITLDELLLINSKVISVENIEIAPKLLNKFIKLWQQGSNPHIEQLVIDNQYFTKADKGIIMKGIKHNVMSANLTREFKSVGLMEPDVISGGLDILRIDGVKATILLGYEFESPTFEILISFLKMFGTLFPNNSTGVIMAEPQAHPLLSFLDDEIVQKLRKMSFVEILQFSLISERCKEFVTSMQIKAMSFSVSIDSDITVKIKKGCGDHNHFMFYSEQDMYWGTGAYGRKKKLTASQSVMISERNTIWICSRRFILTKNDLTMQEWLKHLQDIFNYHEIDYIWFSANSSQFDIDDIKEVFGNTTDVRIGDTGCLVFNQMVLENFFHIEKLQIKASNLKDSRFSKEILMQNFVELEIFHEMEGAISLKELLLINSKRVLFGSLHMSLKELNKFIKLWQKGSNPQLEYLCIDRIIVNEGDKEVIMRGIEHQVIPADQRRTFKTSGNGMPKKIKGGIDIFRMDGVKATIQFRNFHPFPT